MNFDMETFKAKENREHFVDRMGRAAIEGTYEKPRKLMVIVASQIAGDTNKVRSLAGALTANNMTLKPRNGKGRHSFAIVNKQ